MLQAALMNLTRGLTAGGDFAAYVRSSLAPLIGDGSIPMDAIKEQLTVTRGVIG